VIQRGVAFEDPAGPAALDQFSLGASGRSGRVKGTHEFDNGQQALLLTRPLSASAAPGDRSTFGQSAPMSRYDPGLSASAFRYSAEGLDGRLVPEGFTQTHPAFPIGEDLEESLDGPQDPLAFEDPAGPAALHHFPLGASGRSYGLLEEDEEFQERDEFEDYGPPLSMSSHSGLSAPASQYSAKGLDGRLVPEGFIPTHPGIFIKGKEKFDAMIWDPRLQMFIEWKWSKIEAVIRHKIAEARKLIVLQVGEARAPSVESLQQQYGPLFGSLEFFQLLFFRCRKGAHFAEKPYTIFDDIPAILMGGREENTLPLAMISEGVYIGSEVAVSDEEALRHLGITAVVNMAGDWRHYDHNYEEARWSTERLECPGADEVSCNFHVHKGFRYYTYEGLEDQPNQVIDLKPVLEFIETQRNEGKKVVIHCKQGKSRSGAVAIAWLMAKGMSYRGAVAHFIEHRGIHESSLPNCGFLSQLRHADSMMTIGRSGLWMEYEHLKAHFSSLRETQGQLPPPPLSVHTNATPGGAAANLIPESLKNRVGGPDRNGQRFLAISRQKSLHFPAGWNVDDPLDAESFRELQSSFPEYFQSRS